MGKTYLYSKFRSNWQINYKTGKYVSLIPSPTGIASDPALTAYGVQQAEELSFHLRTLSPPIERVYSSPSYRCLQTITPTVNAIVARDTHDASHLMIRGETGVGEWYGKASFAHPSTADPKILKKLFTRYDESYESFILPSSNGETIDELYERCTRVLSCIIEQCDREKVKTALICTHAATLISMGRVLTGKIPRELTEEDFRPFTCGLTSFVREKQSYSENINMDSWAMTANGDCSFLSGGEQRGWKFSGDESFNQIVSPNPLL